MKVGGGDSLTAMALDQSCCLFRLCLDSILQIVKQIEVFDFVPKQGSRGNSRSVTGSAYEVKRLVCRGKYRN